MDWQRVLSTNDFHKPRYVGWLPPMHAQNTLRMKRIVLQRGGWNRGSIASDDRIGRHCLLDLPNRYLFDYASSCPVRIEMLIRSHCGAGTATYLRDACLFSQTVISNVLPKIKTPPIIASEVNFSFSQIAAMGIPKNVIK